MSSNVVFRIEEDPCLRTCSGSTQREHICGVSIWIKVGDADLIRAIFERAISLSLPPEKMKFLFKKYLECEKSIGDERRTQSVKEKGYGLCGEHFLIFDFYG